MKLGRFIQDTETMGNAHVIEGNVDCGIALPPNLS